MGFQAVAIDITIVDNNTAAGNTSSTGLDAAGFKQSIQALVYIQ
jgi:hypothetical protein